jgi:hypothetical protein
MSRSAPVPERRACRLGHGRVLDALPGRRQDVGEVDEALVRRAVGHLDRQRVAERDAQELGLAARDLPVELRVAEQRRALVVLVHLRRLALRVEPVAAHPALLAADVERDDDAVARLDGRDLRPDLATTPIGSWPRMSPS